MQNLTDAEIELRLKTFIPAFNKRYGAGPQIALTKQFVEDALIKDVKEYTLAYLTDYHPLTVLKFLQILTSIADKHTTENRSELLEAKFIQEVLHGTKKTKSRASKNLRTSSKASKKNSKGKLRGKDH